ncbi:potassium channel family protein [Rhizobium mongolense]|uniref:potassium channel family protein n=2 Tax=Rhizobium mongolense TaxID=57676 RepID=UPI0034A48EC1
MLVQIFMATVLLLATILIHGAAVMILFRMGRNAIAHMHRSRAYARLGISCFFVVGFVLAHVIEIMLWATAYRFAGELQSFEEATYFSAITYATIGYGDITLSREWRLASAIEGVNGILLFGWTTAFLFKVSELLWFSKSAQHPDPHQG